MILVAGPYRSGTSDDPMLIARNVAAMTDTALRLFRAGHLPVMGEWFALPLIEHAGSSRIGDPVFDEIFHPISRRLVAKCDGCLRIGGVSFGVDLVYVEGPDVLLGRRNDVPVDTELGEMVLVERGDVIRTLPAHRARIALYGISPAGERAIGEYTLLHSPWSGARA